MIRHLIIFLLPYSSLTAFQGIDKVDKINGPEDCVGIVKYIAQNFDSIDCVYVEFFLKSLSNPNCLNNTEFSESSNGLIFRLIDQKPRLFFETLFKLKENYIEHISSIIIHPVSDRIKIKQIYENIGAVEMPCDLKEKSLSFMKPTYEAYMLMIKNWEEKNKKKWPE